MRRFCLLAAFLTLAADYMTPLQAATPNVVLLLVDDMGYGDPGCYNPNSKIPTPHIDRLATEGMRFTDAHAAGPLCHVSRYGLMTGRYPFRTNCGLWRKQAVIDENQVTVASLLTDQGYKTGMVGKWHLGFDERGYDKPLPGGPIDRGFQSFFGIRASTDIPPYFYIRGDKAVQPPTNHIEANNTPGWSPIQGAFWRAGGIAPDLDLGEVLPRFTLEAERFLDQQSNDKPFFLHLALPAPHTPWLPTDKYIDKSGAGLYGDFTMMVDDMIGHVLRKLDDKGLSKNTLVIFGSDNGPTWYDIDVDRFSHDSAGGLRGMKADAWEAGHRIPFLVRWPGRVREGSVTSQLVGFTDVLATLAGILEVDLPENAGPDSVDFSPVLLGIQPENIPIRPSLAVASGNGTMTLRQGPWKYIDGLGSGGFSKPSRVKPTKGGPTGQLYNLDQDPDESENLYEQYPDLVEKMKNEITKIRANE